MSSTKLGRLIHEGEGGNSICLPRVGVTKSPVWLCPSHSSLTPTYLSQDDFSRISWTSEQLGKKKGQDGEEKTLEYLTSDIAAIEEDIKMLMETLNSTDNQLKDEKLRSKKNEEDKVLHEVRMTQK